MEHLATFEQNTHRNQQQNVTQLEFNQAMMDFKVMFPAMDEDVIEMVLRANQGAVDATIDQLLQMSGEQQNTTATNTNHNLDTPPNYIASQQYQRLSHNVNHIDNNVVCDKLQKASINELEAFKVRKPSNLNRNLNWNNLAYTGRNYFEQSAVQKRSSKWNPPLLGKLPKDFLRINNLNEIRTIDNGGMTCMMNDAAQTSCNEQQMHLTSNPLSTLLLQKKMQENQRQRSQLISNYNDTDTVQYLEDERIAILLQNEEFVSELRRNKEFMTALTFESMRNREQNECHAITSNSKSFYNENYTGSIGPIPNESNQNYSDADFKEKLKNMGKLSRKKFAQLAGLFSRKKSNLPSRDNLLLGSDDAYSQLENDCSDNEDHHASSFKYDQNRH